MFPFHLTKITKELKRDGSDRVRAISLAMGLTPVIWSRISPLATFDTGGKYRSSLSFHQP